MSLLLLSFLASAVLADMPNNLVRVCTSHEMKNAVADACNFNKRSIRFSQPSPFEGYRLEMTRRGFIDPPREYGYQPEVRPGRTRYQQNRQPQYQPGEGQPQYQPGEPQPQYQPGEAQPQYQPGEAQPQYQPGEAQPQYRPNAGQPEYQPNYEEQQRYYQGVPAYPPVRRRTAYYPRPYTGGARGSGTYSRRSYNAKPPRTSYYATAPGYFPTLSRAKRYATDNSEMDKIMRKCCYEGCPLNWFAPLCY